MSVLNLQVPGLHAKKWEDADFESFVSWLKQTILTLNSTFSVPLSTTTLQMSVAQAIPTGAWTAVTFDTTLLDPTNIRTGNLVTIPQGGDGVYIASGNCCWAAGAGTARGLGFQKNGAGFGHTFNLQAPAGGGNGTGHSIVEIISLSAGDTLGLIAFQDTGGNLALGVAGVLLTTFSIVGPLR